MQQLFLFIKNQLTALKIMGLSTFHIYLLCLILRAKETLKTQFPFCLFKSVSVYFSDKYALNNYLVLRMQKY